MPKEAMMRVRVFVPSIMLALAACLGATQEQADRCNAADFDLDGDAGITAHGTF